MVGVQVIVAADEVVDSIDKEQLAKLLSLKPDPEDEESQVYNIIIIYYHCSLINQMYQLLLNAVFLEHLLANRKLRKKWKKHETS